MKMVQCCYQISKEDYEKAQEEGAYSLITDPALLNGYGVYGARVFEQEGKYYLSFERGSHCD